MPHLVATARSAGNPEAGGVRRADPPPPAWLVLLFWLCVLQLPFELPFSILPVRGFVITHLEATLLVLILGYAGWRMREGGIRLRPHPGTPETWVLVWLGALVLSAGLAPGFHTVSIKFILRSAAIAALFWISRDVHRTGRSAAGLLACLAAIVAAAGIIEGFGRIEPLLQPFRPRPSFDEGVWRLTSTFSHANQTAAWLGMSLPIVLALGLKASSARTPGTRSGRGRGTAEAAGWAFVAGILLWALLSTLGRGGIAAGAIVGVAVLGVGASSRRTRKGAIGLLAMMACVAGVRLGTSAELQRRFHVADPGPAYSAAYDCPAKLTMTARSERSVDLGLINTGFTRWSPGGAYPVHLSYHLYDLDRMDRAAAEGVRTDLPATIGRNASVRIRARLVAPADTGLYIVAWDVVRETVLWFTWHRVPPGVTLLRVLPGGTDLPVAPDPRFDEWPQSMDPSERQARFIRLAGGHTFDSSMSRADARWQVARQDPDRVPRRLLWRTALDLFRERPLTGWGPDTFRYLSSGKMGLAHPNTDLQAHDLYLELLATGGLLSLAAWIGFLGVLIAGLRRTLKSDQSSRILALGWAGAVLVFCLHGLVDSFFGSYELMGLFWTSAGALAVAAERPSAERAGMIQPADAN